MRQEDRIMSHLRAVGNISSVEAGDLYRVRDLPKRISVLKREGAPITRILKRDVTGQRYARYFYEAA